MKWRRVAGLCAATLCFACAEPFIGPSAGTDRASLFDDMWHQLDLHYSFFQLKQINWDSIGGHYRPLALAATSDQDFAGVLARMLAELEDVHVSITPNGAGSTMRYLSACDTMTTYFDAHLIFDRYVPVSQQSTTGHLRYGMVAPAVGYVYIDSFEGDGWAGETDAALAYLAGATSLVIDVRNNAGGDYTLAEDVAGRFADQKRTFGYVRRRNGPAHDAFTDYTAETIEPQGTVQFRGPVYVLSNRRDFSSAEDFLLAMRSLPNVTIVGDTTAGASGGPIVRELANGWTYQLSEWIDYTPEHHTFEGIGLAPDVVVHPTAADAAKRVDAVLERALSMAGFVTPF